MGWSHEKLAKRPDVQKVEWKGGEEDRHCDGDSIKADLDRMGEEWRNRAIDRSN